MQNDTTAQKIAIGLFAFASLLLAFEPVRWLLRTWADPSYQSSGLLYAAGVLLLIAWSATSRRLESGDTAKTHALMLLICAAVLRLH